MDKHLIQQIKSHADKFAVEELLKEATHAMKDEVDVLLSTLDDTDKDFTINFYEERIYILNDELSDIIKYLKKKHGEICNESLNESTLLIKNIECEQG